VSSAAGPGGAVGHRLPPRRRGLGGAGRLLDRVAPLEEADARERVVAGQERVAGLGHLGGLVPRGQRALGVIGQLADQLLGLAGGVGDQIDAQRRGRRPASVTRPSRTRRLSA
jgi:hypothetical protein